MGVVLTPLYTEDFTTDPLQNPLNSTIWKGDVNVFNDPNDLLQVVSNTPPPGVTGKCCQTSTLSPEQIGFGYWAGDTTASGFVSVKVGFLNDNQSGISLLYSAASPRDIFGGGGFYLQINGPMNSVDYQLIYEEPGGNNPQTLFDLPAQTLNEGDIVTIAYIGISHYGFVNGVQVMDVDYPAVPNVGGALTAGLSTQVVDLTDAQILAVTLGTAAETGGGGGGNSSWLSVAANNMLRGSRSH